jgi:hypothetical protein
MTETTTAAAENRGPKRKLWAAIWRIISRLFIGWIVLILLVFGVFGGLGVAYFDLTGPHCDQHLMSAGDTCSTLTSRPGRSQQTIERLNPAGAAPVELVAPANWHAEAGQLHTYVYDQAGMREFHRGTGLLCLSMSVLVAVMLARVLIGIIRAKRSPRVEETNCAQTGSQTK